MNLFVARLNTYTNTKDLHKLFSHYGLVTTVKIIFDHGTGKSKCYGFVEMPNNHEAHEALKELNETLFQENIISVKESQAPEPTLQEGGQGSQNRGSTATFSRNSAIRDYKQNSPSKDNTQQGDKTLRNLGYRGSGYRTFR